MASNDDIAFKVPDIKFCKPSGQKILKTVHVDSKKAVEANKSSSHVPEYDYKVPSWSGTPMDSSYSLQVIKGGVIISNTVLEKACTVVGRKEDCDIVMEHPSISRYHAIIQYKPSDQSDVSSSTGFAPGFYIYDLGSTHGTFVNKEQVPARFYQQLKVGYCLKFGFSSRLFVLEGPSEDDEAEDTIAAEVPVKQTSSVKDQKNIQQKDESSIKEDEGINWGIGEDAEEEISEINPFAVASNEELYLEDPKKTLRGWFEREGYDLEYKVEEKGNAHFICRVQLPLDTPSGEDITAEAVVKGGKKKEAVIQCALEACRILDRLGELRKSHQASKRKRVAKGEDDDDSDDDEFLDRTGSVERKRQMRAKMAAAAETGNAQQVETYESLTAKLDEMDARINEINQKLEESKQKAKDNAESSEADDSLEAFMKNLKSQGGLDKAVRSKLRLELATLFKERVKLVKLVNIAKPPNLPPLKTIWSASAAVGAAKPVSLITGSIKRPTKAPLTKDNSEQRVKPQLILNEGEEEEEDDASDDDDVGGDAGNKSGVGAGKKISVETSKPLSDKSASTSTQPNEEKAVIVEANDSTPHGSDLKVVKQPALQSPNTSKARPAQKPFTIGPALPASVNKLSVLGGKVKPKGVKRHQVFEEETETEHYQGWLPPKDQTGDGKTALNDKLGY